MQNAKEYDFLKVIATLLVVFGHAAIFSLSDSSTNGYGSWDYSDIISGAGSIGKIIVFTKNMIYSFHMPLFFAISGAIYGNRVRTKGKYAFWELIAKKSKRLLIPYLAVSVISSAVKYGSGYYSQSEHVFRDVLFGQFFNLGNTHLWFLPCLFSIYLLVWLSELGKDRRVGKLFLFLVVSCLGKKLGNHNLSNPLQYLFFFYFGLCIDAVPERLPVSGKRVGSFFAAFLFFFLLRCCLTSRANTWEKLGYQALSFAIPIAGIVFFFALAKYMGGKSERLFKNAVYASVLRNSFGIYLYSDPINYVIMAILSPKALSPFQVLVLFLTRLFLSLVISICLSELLRKCKIKYII